MSKAYNTKVSKGTKQLVLQRMQENDIAVYFNPDKGITIALKYMGSGLVLMSYAVCSKREKKFRKSVGAFYAVGRIMIPNERICLPESIAYAMVENYILYTAGY